MEEETVTLPELMGMSAYQLKRALENVVSDPASSHVADFWVGTLEDIHKMILNERTMQLEEAKHKTKVQLAGEISTGINAIVDPILQIASALKEEEE